MVNFLLENGIKPHSDKSDPLLHLTNCILDTLKSTVFVSDVRKKCNKYLKIASLLLKHGANINVRTEHNETALIVASRWDNTNNLNYHRKLCDSPFIEFCKFLINAGIDLQARDKQFYSVFKTTNQELLKLVLAKEEEYKNISARRAFLSAGLTLKDGKLKYANSPLALFFRKDGNHDCTEIILEKANMLPATYKNKYEFR